MGPLQRSVATLRIGGEPHARARGCVLATLAFHAVRTHEVGRDQPRVQTQSTQLASPVMGTRARLHRHQTAPRQQRALTDELISLQRPRHHAPARRIHRMHLDHAFGQVHTYPRNRRSCNLAHGLPLSSFRLKIAIQSWCSDTVTERWEVPSYSIERTFQRPLRALWPAAHVERWASQE